MQRQPASKAAPESALGAWNNFQQKELQNEVFMAFGYGDGGGGPTREMLENLRAMAHFPALPQVRQRHAGDFFRDLEQDSGTSLPTWNGELYLEYHRGTYTTQSRSKRAKRKSEFLLHDAEFLASLACQLDPDYAYPGETFAQSWQLVCLNQFHGIIPGSSIGQVYVDSQAQYTQVQRLANQVRQQALACLAVHLGADLLLVNTTSFSRRDLAWYPEPLPAGRELLRADGMPVAMQSTTTGTWIDAGETTAVS